MNLICLNGDIKTCILLFIDILIMYLKQFKYIIQNDILLYDYKKIKRYFGSNFAMITCYCYCLAWSLLLYSFYKLTKELYANLNIMYNHKVTIQNTIELIRCIFKYVIIIFVMTLLYSY